MRKGGAALAAALILSSSRAFAASAEPELVPMQSGPRRPRKVDLPAARPLKEAEPAPRAPAPKDEPLGRDDTREILRRTRPKRPYLITRARAWFAQASVDTRYALQVPSTQVTPPGLEVFYGETREQQTSGVMVVYGAEVAPLDWLGFEGEFGEDRRSGTMYDRFWVDARNAQHLTNNATGATWDHPDHEDDTVFESDHRARRDWAAASAHFRVLDGKVLASEDWEIDHALDLTVGAHRFRQDGRFANERVTRSDGKFFPQVPLGPVAGQNGTYTAQWRGPHIGFREEMTLPRGFSMDAMLLWSPFMEFRGDGYDNGAAALRGETPNYTDRSHGSALHFRLGAAWTWSVLRFEAGYMRLAFSSHRGNRRYYLAGGGIFDQPLEKTETEVSGLYVGGSLRY